jgi:hypothetical protein
MLKVAGDDGKIILNNQKYCIKEDLEPLILLYLTEITIYVCSDRNKKTRRQ